MLISNSALLAVSHIHQKFDFSLTSHLNACIY